MMGLTEQVFLLRAAGIFLRHISDMKMQMKVELPVFLFKDALDYVGYIPLFYLVAMVGGIILQDYNFLIFFLI